jgi:hypothetical protein
MVDAGIDQIAETCINRDESVISFFIPPVLSQMTPLQEPLSHIPATLPTQLQSALHNFSVWLSGLEVVQSPRLSQLTAQRLHMKIHHSALERIARSYQLICEQVKKPENKYEAASTLLGSERPFGQVNLLWQIFGLDGDSIKET